METNETPTTDSPAVEKSHGGPQKEMPRYECHKVVWALKIASFNIGIDSGTITPAEDGFEPFEVGAVWINERYKPDQGDLGYYVVYEDGFVSWSPTEAFEKGYTLIP